MLHSNNCYRLNNNRVWVPQRLLMKDKKRSRMDRKKRHRLRMHSQRKTFNKVLNKLLINPKKKSNKKMLKMHKTQNSPKPRR